MQDPSRDIALYGTDEQVPPPRNLRAGMLTAELEAGNLRYIRWNDAEVLRAVSFIVRDRDWGTWAPVISDLKVAEDRERFAITFHAVAGDAERFSFDAQIEGRADGTLTFRCVGVSDTGFETNRTGFVILHPIDGIAGTPVTIRHTDGKEVSGNFPEIIDPVQPMIDLRALSHTTPGGLKVEVLMEGDTFEMEDQRNWSDASFKTYVRPLSRPWPYRIDPDEQIQQTITVTVSGTSRGKTSKQAIQLAVGPSMGRVPPLGLGLRPEDKAATRGAMTLLRDLGPAHLILHHDPRAGHDRASLSEMLDIARDMNADPWLEAVIVATDDTGAAAEVAALGRMAASLGNPFTTVLVSPASDLKCTLPGSEWPPAPDAATLYDATRGAFPDARIGGGMFSYFTELNRKRPPTGHLDVMTFTTSPLVHAGDDRSVMETREAYPAITASATRIADGTSWAVGPSAIGVRDNPYGASAKDNPANIRQAMNRNDPRQRGLLGAAWALGYFSGFAAGGASAIALGGCTGAFGAVAVSTDDPQPWFETEGIVYPVFHVLRGLARLVGADMRALDLPANGQVCGLAAGSEIWLANTGADPVCISIPPGALAITLDAASFATASSEPGFMNIPGTVSGTLRLDSFAVARVITP